MPPLPRASAWLLALLLALAAGVARAVEFKSSLERNPIHAGESVRLVLELDGSSGGRNPDLRALEADFHIVHTSVNTQIELVSGQQSTTTRWIVEITPKREGSLEIPPISIGRSQSAALRLDVLPARPAGDAGNRDIFLEAEISPDPAYVQAQMRLVVRLLRAVDVVDGTLTEPAATNAVLRRLGRDISYTTDREGRSYRVLERRYAVFPQASGELVVAAVQFEGEVVDPGQAGTGLSRLFARGKRLRLRTPVIRASAIPPPDDAPADPWLPAKNLQLSEEWSTDPNALRAGEPVTRTLKLEAVGLGAEQLPEVPVSIAHGVKEYGDQPIVRTTTDNDWVHGVREQRIALVPGNAGTYQLPEIRIDWWDSERNAPRQAIIPARVLTVAAAPHSAGAPAPGAPAVPADAQPARTLWQRTPLWQGVSALLLVLWLATVIAWRHARARAHTPGSAAAHQDPPKGRPLAALRHACLRDDPRGARAALLEWAASAWPQQPPRNLNELARQLPEPRLGAELAALDRALYAPDPEPWRGESLWQRARESLVRPAPAKAEKEDDLPLLYPR